MKEPLLQLWTKFGCNQIATFKGDSNIENLIKMEHTYTKPNQMGTYMQGESEKKSFNILSNFLWKKKNYCILKK